jgi:hypothetical protein
MDTTSLYAGDTLNFIVSVGTCPASDGWTLNYRLVPSDPTQEAILFVAVPQGDDYLVQVGPSVTSAWVPGGYSWASWVAMPGARNQVDSGLVTILTDPAASAPGYDPRSQAQKALDDAKAALAAYNASNGLVSHYTIGTRQMQFRAAAEIIALIDFWKHEVAVENVAASLAEGLGNPRRLFIRFGGGNGQYGPNWRDFPAQ